MNTRALILAAGQGTRLRPLTDDRPKCLVPLLGQPLLERQASALHRSGITELAVVGGYRADQIETLGYTVILNPEYETSNMVASLFCARNYMRHDKHLLICYGDIVCQPAIIKALLDCDAPVAVTVDLGWRAYWELRLADPLADAETLKLGPQNRLLELGKKPRSYDEIQAQYMGLIKIRADEIEHLKQHYDRMDRGARYDGKDFKNMYMTSFIQHLIDHGWPVQAVPITHGWLEVDSTADLQLYERMQVEGKLKPFFDQDA